jgi:uncharacterized protein (DUF1800 family)/fibronectin type 3 domain-containing protein
VTRAIRRYLFVTIAILISQSAASATDVPPSPLPSPPATAPATLTATGGNARVTLAWPAVEGATSYKIYRAAAGVWNPNPIASTSSITYTNGSLTNGTWYTYKVAGYNGGGIGPQSAEASAFPMAPPTGVTATAGDTQVTLAWLTSPQALTYTIYRSTSSEEATLAPIATGVTALSFLDTGLTNKTKYYYRIRAVADGASSVMSAKVYAIPLPPPPTDAPANLVAAPGNARVTLTWGPVANALGYYIFRLTNGTFTKIATTAATTYRNTGLTNGTTYSYRVAAYNDGGRGPFSSIVTATPIAPPLAPATISAVGGDHQVMVDWATVADAASYKVYRSSASGRYSSTPLAADLSGPPFVDSNLENGPTFFYTVIATNAGGNSPRSPEARATTEGPPLVIDAETRAAFRLLRQATWGARPGDVDHVKQVGAAAFIDEQFAASASVYPATLFNQPLEIAQEYFFYLARTGSDQLRQRVAWALHKIWVVSAVDVESVRGIVTYHNLLLNNAFGNYRDLMEAVTLNPAMGRYLNMLNNRSQQVTGTPPNENYARELMQLFTIGTATLNPNGTPAISLGGAPVPAYTEADVAALARILTGWTYGDGNPATLPTTLANRNNLVPMEPVEAYHDAGAKAFLGEAFPAGASAVDDLDHALDLLFNHPNVGPFIASQLIKQLVTSNPSPAYVGDVAAVFNNSGGVRGDIGAVVRAILVHPEASLVGPDSGKLAEPALFVLSLMRALNASVTDHPFLADWAAEMGQKVFYPNSVFSYFSPGYRVRGTAAPVGLPLMGPEFQILTSVTSLVRANFVGELLGGWFGESVVVDYTPFTSIARDAAALVDYCNLVFMGGRMSPQERAEIIGAVRATPISDTRERMRTALYLTLVMAQSQVDW